MPSKTKKQTNDNGGSDAATGYIEYTASELGMYDPEPPLRSRIVYNYVANIIYFSPLHYHSWTFKDAKSESDRRFGQEYRINRQSLQRLYIITNVMREHWFCRRFSDGCGLA